MSHVFSHFIRDLDGGGEPPTPEAFEELWDHLAATLKREIKRRGLWLVPPAYLGVTGSTQWQDGAVEELVGPCYEHIFIERLGGLLAQLKVKENVDGLVLLHVRNFLHDLQRRHDPLGFRLYNVVRRSLLAAIEDGELRVLAGDPRLRRETVLALVGADDSAALSEEIAEGGRLVDLVRRWNDDLLPDLVTSQGPAQASVAARLRRCVIADLPMEGIAAFRFGDLLEPLKVDVRGRWARLLDQDLGDAAFEDDEQGWPQLVRRIEASDELEQRQAFESLVGCVTEAVSRYPGPAATARYLSTLWQFLRSWSTDEAAEEDVEPPGIGQGALPSRRRLSTLLRIPRDRMTELFGQLGEMIEACRAATGGHLAVNSLRSLEDRHVPGQTRRTAK